MMLLVCPSGFSLKGYDVINYDSNKSWVDVINDVGMEKSLRELKNKRLYDKVVMLNDININVEETNNLGRYTIYSYNCSVEKKYTGMTLLGFLISYHYKNQVSGIGILIL